MRSLWILVALCAASLRGQTPETTLPVQRGLSQDRDTVTVGDPFRVVIRIRAPRGATIEFPTGPDTTRGVAGLDPVDVATAPDSAALEQLATYRLAAWDVGVLAIRFDDVIVRLNGAERRVPVGGDIQVTVVSVLPADSSDVAPKAARDVIAVPLPWWVYALAALLLAVVIALAWWLWSRRKRRGAMAVIDPYDAAVKEFEQLESMGLLGAGESAHYVAVAIDIVRRYLSRATPAAVPSLTTPELIGALRGDSRVPLTRLARLLQDADLVKFAAERVSADEAEHLGAESRHVVDVVHTASNPSETREAA